MKVLIVCGHPDTKSLNAALARQYAAHAESAGNQVETLFLGQADFDPVLRFGYRERMPADDFITHSQELLAWANIIVFFYPIWWSSMPSLLKGWLDRVLTPGVACNMEHGIFHTGLLAGRTAELWLTSNGPAVYYRWLSPLPVRLMRHHILRLCGIKVTAVRILGNAEEADDRRRAAWLKRVQAAAEQVR